MKTNPTLPQAIAEYFETSNRFDAPAAAACFTPDAIVHDEGKTYAGTADIQEWVARTSKEYQPQANVLRAQREGDQLVVTANITGQFPQSPIDLDFHFSLRDEKIAALSVH